MTTSTLRPPVPAAPAGVPDTPLQLASGIWWVGAPSPTGHGYVHAYLIQTGTSGILVDPGSAATVDAVMKRVNQVLPISQIRAVLVHSSAPDVAGALVPLGNLLNSHAIVITDDRSAEDLRTLGVRVPIRTVEALDRTLDLGGGRRLQFVSTPYLRNESSFVTYDTLTESLFSGHLFSATPSTPNLAAQPDDLEDVLRHHERSFASSDVLSRCLAAVRAECPALQRLLPASGYLVPHTLIDRLIAELSVLECGTAFRRAESTPSMVHLAGAVRRLREHVPLVHGLAELDRVLRAEMASGIPVLDTMFEVELPGEGVLRFSAGDGFGGAVVRFFSDASDKRLVLPVAGETDEPTMHLVINLVAASVLDRDAQLLLPTLWPAIRRVVTRSVESRADDRARRTLEELSRRDPLTGLYNRRAFDEVLPTGETRGVMMIRVEGFAGIYEDAGYDIGDLAVQRLTSVLSSTFRLGDTLIRYDGVDFLVIVRVENRDELAAVADRVRMAVAACDLGAIVGARHLTASVGATLLGADEPLLAGRRRADEALYDARRFGRDSVAFKMPATV